MKSLVEKVYKFINDNNLTSKRLKERQASINKYLKEFEEISKKIAKSGSMESDLIQIMSRRDQLRSYINDELGLLLESCTRNDQSAKSKAKTLGVKSQYFDDLLNLKVQLFDAPTKVKSSFNTLVRYFDNQRRVLGYRVSWQEYTPHGGYKDKSNRFKSEEDAKGFIEQLKNGGGAGMQKSGPTPRNIKLLKIENY